MSKINVSVTDGTNVNLTVSPRPVQTITVSRGSSGQGTVTNVTGTGEVSGITLSGSGTENVTLTLGGALDLSSPPIIGDVTSNDIYAQNLTVYDNCYASNNIEVASNTGNGAVRLYASNNFYVDLTTNVLPGTYTLKLPTGIGTSGQALITDGINQTSWADRVGSITSADGSITVTGTTTRDLSVSSSPNVIVQVRNNTGATLTKGTAVYINGAIGQLPTVTKAQANSDAASAQTLGLMTTDLANNANGYVTIIGLITNINTSAYTDGQQLYLSSTVAGGLTATKPQAPQHLVYVAVVEHAHITQGKLFVKVQNGYELDELHDVQIISPTNGQTLTYDSATSLWKNTTPTLGTVTSVTATSPVQSTGGTTPVISMPAATTSISGYLTSTDWNTFNNKQPFAGSYTYATLPNAALYNAGTFAWTTDYGSFVSDGTNWKISSNSSNIIYANNVSAIKGDGVTDDSTAINTVCLFISNAGGGTLVFDAKTYYIPSGIKAYTGVRLQGQGYKLSQNSLSDSWAYSSGTRLKGNNTNPAYYGNCNGWFQRVAQQTSQPTITNVIAQGLMNVGCDGILFDTVTFGIRFGSLYNTGAFYNSSFTNLACVNFSVWGFSFENTTSSMFRSLNCYNAVAGASGSIYFGSSQTAYNAGVLDINKLECYPNNSGSSQNIRGIVVQARAGAQFNAVQINSATVSNGGNVKVSQAATMSNGSATITVTDGTKFPKDIPVTVSATANGFTINQTYFVVKNGTADGLSANQVQISNTQAGAAVSATGATAVNLVTMGYPILEICGRNITNDFPTAQDKIDIPSISTTTTLATQSGQVKGFSGIKIYPEGLATCCVLWQAAGADLKMSGCLTGSPGTKGTTFASHLCVRSNTGAASSGRFNVVDQIEALVYDADSTSSGSGLFCSGAVVASGGFIQSPIVGFYNDNTGVPVFNLTDSHNSTTPTFKNILPSDNLRCMTYPAAGIGQRQELISYVGATYTLDSTHIGTMVFTNATPGTWVFPNVNGATAAGTSGSWIGTEFEFVNAGGAALTLNSYNATQSFNKVSSGKTSYSLAVGGTMKVRICTDGTNAFLAVIANNGAT